MDTLGYLGIGYGLAWLAFAGYLLSIARRQKSLERRVQQLQGRREEQPRG